MASSSTSVPVVMTTDLPPPYTPSPSQPTGLVDIKTDMPPPYTPSPSQLVDIKTEMPPPYAPSESQRPLNLPDARLLGDRHKYLNICVPLYKASVKGDWEKARDIIDKNPVVIRCSITDNCDTALHIAASAKNTKSMEKYVQNLLHWMTSEDLELQNRSGNTVLCLAAARGNVSIAKSLVDYNPSQLNIPGNQGMLPLYIASLYGKYEMVKYLYDHLSMNMNNDHEVWTDQSRGSVLVQCVEADFYDIALQMVNHWPTLALRWGVLGILARKTNAFREIEDHFIWKVIRAIIQYFGVVRVAETESHATQLLNIMWNYIVERPKAEVDDIIRGPPDIEPEYEEATTLEYARQRKYSSRVQFIAAEMGNTTFLVKLVRLYPDLLWKVNDRNQSIFHVAISHRQEGIYNLMYEIGMTDFIAPLRDVDGNNMLHLAAMSAKKKRLQEIPGVALQMQRELLWYKEVESMLPPSYQEQKNKAGLLPHELFTEEHKDLMSASEKWMKDTASQSMVVAALIATIVFAAAFTVPGGYKDNGFPIFLHRKAFTVFVISDALSLTFATISILMFLYILTSRYAEQDFLETLPKKLMKGIATLFLSIVAMMVAFSASFFVLYKDQIWVPILITVFASAPVILFARHQFGLLADVYRSTYGSKNLFKPKKAYALRMKPQDLIIYSHRVLYCFIPVCGKLTLTWLCIC